MELGQFKDDSPAPGIMRNRWLQRDARTFETRRYYYHPIENYSAAG